jgi:putative transposase
MPNYLRPRIPGASYFLTVALADRRSDLLVRRIAMFRESLLAARRRHPFRVVAMVVLPDHWHAIWTLPQGDGDCALRVGQLKAAFSRAVPEAGVLRASLVRRRERGIWQRRYWEHIIRDERDLQAHIAYIHGNPVKHGLVERAEDWPYSTLARSAYPPRSDSSAVGRVAW